MRTLATIRTLFACASLCLLCTGNSNDDHLPGAEHLRVGNDVFVGAKPVSPETWVTLSDHPESTFQRLEAGEVSIAFDITGKGHAANCRVTSPSGNSRFDDLPCKLVMRRARFVPLVNYREIQPGAHGEMRFSFNNAR